MGLFSDLMSKIFSHAATTTPVTGATSAAQTGAAATAPSVQPAAAPAKATATPPETVDVAAILDGLAARIPKNWIGNGRS